jgi:hypothetical protein
MSRPARRIVLLLVFVTGCSEAGSSTGFAGSLVSLVRGMNSLLSADAIGTLTTTTVWGVKILLGALPSVVLFRQLRRGRFVMIVWLPVLFLQSLLSLRACPDTWQWVALISASGLGSLLVRFRWFRFAIALPAVVLIYIPGLNHANATLWHGHRLIDRCAANDGRRPSNLTGDLIAPIYFGAEPFPDGSWLLTSHRGSANTVIGSFPISAPGIGATGSMVPAQFGPGTTWLRRRGPSDFVLGDGVPLAPDGHYWLSCRVGNQIWFPSGSHCLSSIGPDPLAGGTRINEVCKEGLDDQEFGIACDSEGGKVFFKKFADGALLVLNTQTGVVRHHRAALAGIGGTMTRRDRDGALLVATVPELNSYDPLAEKILSRTGAGLVPMGVAVCQSDGMAAVTDFAGRLRLFTLDAQGRYEFAWGINLFAPRSVAFAPDCRHLAVGSGDDRHVWLVDLAARKVQATYNVGPSLRRVTFPASNELAVVDACTVSSFLF